MFKSDVILSFTFLTIAACLGERVRYDNYRIYHVQPSHLEELKILNKLQTSTDSIIFLNEIHAVNKTGILVVAPHKIADFQELLQEHHIDYTLVERNLQQQIDNTYGDVAESTQRELTYGWKNYYKLADTYRWLQSLANAYEIASIIEAGTTYQGRTILGIKISKGNTAKPGIFLEAGIHAREWIAPATATYIINQLLTSNEPRITNLVEKYDWYIIPHANPDGYVYTHVKDRMWRKTRKPYGACYGADPNRNWGFEWNTVGSTDNPCTDTFAGPSAFSEIETRTLSDYLKSLKGKLSLYISFHAFSQLLLYPYGHTAKLPENHKDIEQVYNVSIEAIEKRHGTVYTGGNIYDAIYPASGASIDWAYATIGTKMSFCYELRPSSNSVFTGFNLPASQIIPTGEETLDSIVAMVNEVEKLGYFKL